MSTESCTELVGEENFCYLYYSRCYCTMV